MHGKGGKSVEERTFWIFPNFMKSASPHCCSAMGPGSCWRTDWKEGMLRFETIIWPAPLKVFYPEKLSGQIIYWVSSQAWGESPCSQCCKYCLSQAFGGKLIGSGWFCCNKLYSPQEPTVNSEIWVQQKLVCWKKSAAGSTQEWYVVCWSCRCIVVWWDWSNFTDVINWLNWVLQFWIR